MAPGRHEVAGHLSRTALSPLWRIHPPGGQPIGQRSTRSHRPRRAVCAAAQGGGNMKMIDRKYAYLQGLLILVLFALGVAVASSSGTDSSVSVTAAGDSYVSSVTPSSNEGDDLKLRVDGDPSIVSYLRFVRAGRLSPASPTPRCRCTRSATSPPGSKCTACPHRGTRARSRSRAHRPRARSSASSGPITSGSWVDIDVTAAAANGGVVDLALVEPVDPRGAFDSRETSNAPQLVVQTGIGGSTSTVSTTTTTTPITTTTPPRRHPAPDDHR